MQFSLILPSATRRPYESSLIDRIHPPPPTRNLPPREDLGHAGRLPPSRDVRYDYPPPREFRRPPSPREFREYAAPAAPPPGRREYDDYRRGPPAISDRDRYPPPPPSDFRGRYPPPPDPSYRSHGGPPPPHPGFYDRYERRPVERYLPPYPVPHGGRPRTPPRIREDFERLPPPRYEINIRTQ